MPQDVGDRLVRMVASFTSSRDGCSAGKAPRCGGSTVEYAVALLAGDSAGGMRVLDGELRRAKLKRV